MKLAVMQPYFFPYIGYFHMIHAVDSFVFYDDVNFIKHGWINRNNLQLNGSPWKFSVPLVNLSSFSLINATKIDSLKFNIWKQKFLKTIELNYKKAPYYNEVVTLISNVFEAKGDSISELAKRSVTATCNYLRLNRKFVNTSAVYNNDNLKAKHRLFDICKQTGTEILVSPIGGSNGLYNKEDFKEQNIHLFFVKSHTITYTQSNNSFVPNLSILDIMMFNNLEKIAELLKEYTLV